MSVATGYAPAVSGPSESRLAFLRKVGLLSFAALAGAAVISVASSLFVAPAISSLGRWPTMIAVIGAFLLSQYVARGMVYGSAKIPGFVLGIVGMGFCFGFLLLSVVSYVPLGSDPSQAFMAGVGVIAKAMTITAASGLGMLVYVWFNKSELSMVKAALSVLGLPMLLLMGLQFVFPIGGVFGLIISVVFVVSSGLSLLYRLNTVVHEFNEDQHVEAAFEISMSLLVLLWNIISLLDRLRR